MKALGRTVLLFLGVLAVSLVLIGSVQAKASSVSCHAINAKGVGQDNGDGTTDVQVIGGGLLHGTTHGSFVATGVTGSVVSIAGTVVFTVNRATLTVSVTGTLDVSNGAFTAAGPVTAATGKLAGATGSLTLSGVEDLSNGTFVETITGDICVDLSP